jgi:alpha-ketoglutarate-dependent taurine dioxygenase
MHGIAPESGPIAIVLGHGEPVDSVDRDHVLQLLRARGAVLFRGFAADSNAFEKLTSRFCPRFLRHIFKELRPSQSADGTTAQVLLGNDWVSLHGEMNYQPFRPDVLWFHCKKPPARGGETIVADGRHILAALSEDTRQQLRHRKIRYRRVLDAQNWQPLMPIKFRPAVVAAINFLPPCRARSIGSDGILLDFIARAIRPSGPDKLPTFINSIENAMEYGAEVTFDDGSPLSPSVLQDIRRAGLACAQDIHWEPDDIAMLDNARVMHGRRSFEGSERSINVRFGMLERKTKRFMS